MLRKSKLLITAATALATLAAAAAVAQAVQSASIGPGGAISSASLGKLTFGTSPAVRCELTLKGTLSSFLTILSESVRLGAITEVSINNGACEGGRIERALSLPWTVAAGDLYGAAFEDIEGPEPRYKKINITGASFLIEALSGFVNCLYEGVSEGFLELIQTSARHFRTGLIRADETVSLRFVRGSELCPRTAISKGNFGLTPTQSMIKL
jgi:hypothetical protein